MPTFDFLFKKLKILPFYGDKLWERWNFSEIELFLHCGFIWVSGNCGWKWRTIRNVAYLTNRGTLGAGELYITFHIILIRRIN